VNQLDDVFEVIGRAAESSSATITSATAGEVVPFVVRTSAIEPGSEPEAPPADESAAEEAEAPAAGEDAGTDTGSGPAPADPSAPITGRQQIDFTIIVTANDMAQATAFLDDLRAGPRLLSSITASTTRTGTGVEVRVDALAFVDAEG
jgi:hypothetical protein